MNGHLIGHKMMVKTNVRINKGRFDISRKEEFVSFREKLSKRLPGTIILDKKKD